MEQSIAPDKNKIVLRGNYSWRDMLKAHRLDEGIAEIFFLPLVLLLFFIPPILQQPATRTNSEFNQLIMSATIITASAFAIITIFHFLVLPSYIRRNFKKEQEQRFEFQFDQDGIEFAREYAQIKQSWELITYFRENKDLILLYPKGRRYVAVPKRAMENGEEERIKGLLNHYAKKNRSLFGSNNYRILVLILLITLVVLVQIVVIPTFL